MIRPILYIFPLLVFWAPVMEAVESNYKFKVSKEAGDLLSAYCYDCHDNVSKKGDVRLDNLESLNKGERLDLLNMALEHAYSGEMPPKKADQPTEKEREQLVQWIKKELNVFKASKLEDKMRYYKYANYLNHEKLFSGEIKEKP